MRKSLETAENPAALEHLAEILEKENRPEAARATWQELLANPDLDEKKRKEIEGRVAGIGAGTTPRP